MSNYDCKGCKHRTNHTDEGFKFCSGCDRSYLGADSGYHADRYEKEEAEMSMTESEAIRRLKDHFRVHDDGRPTPYLDEAVSMAIHSLEEVQQLHAIGTVSEFRESKNFLEFLYNHIQPNEMEQYLAMYHASGRKGE